MVDHRGSECLFPCVTSLSGFPGVDACSDACSFIVLLNCASEPRAPEGQGLGPGPSAGKGKKQREQRLRKDLHLILKT